MFVAILLVTVGTEVAQSRQLELPTPEAWEALKRGDAAKAASLFREALDRSPRNPMLHFGAGWAAYALGEYDAATSALKRALEYDSSFVQAAALLGMVAYANSDLDLAIRSMEKAAALAPNDTRHSPAARRMAGGIGGTCRARRAYNRPVSRALRGHETAGHRRPRLERARVSLLDDRTSS